MPGLFDGTSLERPVTCERCERPMAECTCPRGAGGAIVLPRDQRVRVQRQTGGRGGKTVTSITGLDPVATDLGAMLKGLRTALGTGGTVKDGVIELQGDHRERVLAHLIGLGYPAKASGG